MPTMDCGNLTGFEVEAILKGNAFFGLQKELGFERVGDKVYLRW